MIYDINFPSRADGSLAWSCGVSPLGKIVNVKDIYSELHSPYSDCSVL